MAPTTSRLPPAARLLVLTLVVVLSWAAGSAGSAAQLATQDSDQLSWSVRPADNEHGTGRPNFGYALEPGEELTDGFVVTNRSRSDLVLDVYAADGFTTPSGHLDLRAAGEPSVGLGSWISTAVDQVRLDPGETVEVAFTISVPTDAPAGDHPGGIVAAHSAEAGSGTVRLDRRLGSRIHVRVAGEQQLGLQVSELRLERRASWNPFAAGETVLRYQLSNTGNVRAFAHETLTLTGPAGLGRQTRQDTVEEIMPGSSVEREVELGGTWPLVRLGADLQLVPEAVGGAPGPAVDADVQTWAVPWLLLLALLLIAAVVAVVTLRRRRRISARGSSSAPASEHATAR